MLYYPWLTIPDLSAPPNVSRTVNVPPSGHIAGICAQVDATVGVHKAPANVEVAGVSGLERILSDRQQGPLNNPGGVNVLRIFPGSGAVTVWGARTTVNTQVQGTDWIYLSHPPPADLHRAVDQGGASPQRVPAEQPLALGSA